MLTFSALYYSWLASEFFNQFLKGIPNHVDDWPRVTLEIRKAPFPFFGNHDDGPVALGWLRVSHRELDETRSIPFQPYHKHQRELKLKPGEIAPVEIEIWPSSTVFEAGEKLRITVQGSDIYFYPEEMHTNGHTRTVNKGRHVIHSGGKYDSHLLVPLI